MKRLILITVILIGLSGCAITATIKHPTADQSYVYEGPKNVEMSIKQGDVEIKYSGKSEGFWAGLLKFLLMKTPDITVIK